MKIDTSKVKKLREMTGAGYIDCKGALVKANGDIDKAKEVLRQRGYRPKGHRRTDHGILWTYMHPGNRVAAMVEIKCESDFVAKTEEIKRLAKEVTMQVAAMNPQYISRNQVDPQLVIEERERRREMLKKEKKPEHIIENIIDGQMSRWYSEVCLLEQPYIKDGGMDIKDLLANLVNQVKENCKITRFSRWEIGLEE